MNAHYPASCRTTTQILRQDCQDEDESLTDIGVEVRYPEHEEHVDDQAEHVRAEQATHGSATPSAKDGTAHDDGCKDLQEERLADVGVSTPRLRAEVEAGETIEEAGQDVGGQQGPPHRDA